MKFSKYRMGMIALMACTFYLPGNGAVAGENGSALGKPAVVSAPPVADATQESRIPCPETAFSGASVEETEVSEREISFVLLDVNRNDVLERMEYPGRNRNFKYLDFNRDGILSRKEFFSVSARWWNQLFEDLDFDGNLLVERSEWLDSTEDFDRLDRNGNGVIERNEFYNPR